MDIVEVQTLTRWQYTGIYTGIYYGVPGCVTGSYTVPSILILITRNANILISTLSNRSQSDYKDSHDPTTPNNGGTGADPQVHFQFIRKNVYSL